MGDEMERHRVSQRPLLTFDFPREVNLYRKVVHDNEQFVKWWASLENSSDAYMSVYGFRFLKPPNYRRGDYQTAIVPHFVLDFDCSSIIGGKQVPVPPETTLNEVRRLHQFLCDEDIRHGVWFSGGGFHVWVKLSKVHMPQTGMDKSILQGAGKHTVREWAEDLSLNCIDPHVTFDLASLIRVPNSYNVKRELWSIPLTTEEIQTLSWEQIQDAARKHRSGYFSYGQNGLDLDLNTQPSRHLQGMLNTDNTDTPTITMDGIAILPCLQASACRQGSNPTHDARYHLASYLAARLRNFQPPQTMVMKEDEHTEQITSFIETLNWVDFDKRITKDRVGHIVKGPYGHTPCWSLFSRGYCVGKCHLWDGTGTIPDYDSLNNTTGGERDD
jgi:hypothetical protein